jgi:hypothetical protein
MTVPKWFIPLLAAVAAIAVAVAGVLIGIRFAPPSVAEVPSATVEVPVLAPVDDPESDDAVPSPVVAETEVTLPGTAPVDLPPGLGAIVDALTEAPDPTFTLMEYDVDEADTDDDPCAPRTGDAPADCPEGLHSTVLSLIAERDFMYSGQAFPPTHAEYLESGNRSGGMLWCDVPPATESSVPFGILSSGPATFSIEYWPTDRPGEVARLDSVSTPDDQRAEYLAALETAESTSDLPLPRTCLTFDDLEVDTAYTAVIAGVDDSGRIAAPRTVRFHTSGAPVHPGAQIVTIGENLVFVSALHPENQSVDVRVHVGDAESVPTCADLPAGGGGELTLSETDVAVSDDEVNAVNAPSSFRVKRVLTYAIPEGSTALVCARWYAAGTAPSWEREQPLHESSAILQSPDRLAPTLTLTSVDSNDDAVTRIGFQVSSVEGSSCGTLFSWRGPDTDLPAGLCRGAYSLRTGGATAEGDRLWDAGFRGDLVVTWTEYRGDVAGEPQRALLPSADGGCRGTCTPPSPQTFRVWSDNSALTLVMDWEQGATNGLADWNVTAVSDVSPDYVRPDEPQFDLDQRWEFTEPTFPPGYGFIAPRDWVNARFQLVVDRPVDYVVRLTSGARGVAAQGCSTDALLEVSGRAERSTPINIPNVCLGGEYYGEIELVDDAGVRVVWNVHDRPHFWAAGVTIHAPTLLAEVSYTLDAGSAGYSYVGVLDLEVERHDMNPMDGIGPRCTLGGIIQSRGADEVGLHSTVLVRFAIRFTDTERWNDGDCTPAYPDDEVTVVEVGIPIAALYSPDGARIELPDAYNSVIVLRASRP